MPEQIVNNILKSLPPRARDVISRRFGVGKSKNRETLEAIGASYGITRERIRQIEASSLDKIRNQHKDILSGIFAGLNNEISSKGGVVHEDNFLAGISDKPRTVNYFYLFLNLGNEFTRLREDDNFYHRWTNNTARADKIHNALLALNKELVLDNLLSEEEMAGRFAGYLHNSGLTDDLPRAALVSLLGLSRQIGKNPIGEWGLTDSAQICPKGVRDLACLVLRKHGKPMHFTEIAVAIKESLNERAHVQTVHNELIKDSQFVLVGRGLYALSSMGYKAGVVADVIRDILKVNGPMTKEEIAAAVLKERYVKESTIFINLQNKKNFQKLDGNVYTLV